MTDLIKTSGSPFDSIRRVREDGSEYWLARELMPLLGYRDWRNFERAIEQAMIVAETAHLNVAANFVATTGVSGSRGPAPKDYELSRYACYVTAMRGDSHKPEIADALTYFAVRTHEAETAPALPDISTPAGVLVMAEQFAATARQLVERDAQIKVLTPKANYVDSFVSAVGDATTIRVLANQVGMAEQALRDLLVSKKVIYRKLEGTRYSRSQGKRVSEYSWHAHAKHADSFVERDQPEAPRLHNGQMRTTLYVTPVGKTRVADLLRRAGEAS
jgi:DNA-damage-inducible protein D